MNPPTDHQLLAAIRVARILDPEGSTAAELEASLPLVVSQGEHRAEDLRIGLALLLDAELVFEGLMGVCATTRLSALTALNDQDALQQLRRFLEVMGQASDRAQVGASGEKAVVEACRNELVALGQVDLIASVVQVSLFNDTLGYDISAPTLGREPRQLEVKTTSGMAGNVFTFYLSRNEYEVGRCNPADWSLVACERCDDRTAIIGWCRAAALLSYLPDDHRGRWTESLVRIPRSLLCEGIPSCV